MTFRLLWPATAIATVALVLAAPAWAQALDPQAGVRADTPSLSFDPGEQHTATWTVTNDGPLAATASVGLQVPQGWTGALAPADRSFTLAAGASRSINVPITPGDGSPANGAATLSATMGDQAGRTSPAASAPVSLAFVPALPPPPPRDYTAEVTAGVAGGAAVLLVAALLVVYARRAGQVALFVEPQQRPITAGTDGVFLVEVQNTGRRPREVELRVEGLPATWYGAFSFPKVALQPGERSPVPLCIKAPREAGDGTQYELVLRARPGRRFPWRVQARTRIEAHDRVRIGNAVPPPASSPSRAGMGA